MLYIDIHIFLRVSVCPFTKCSPKLRVRATLTETWIRLHITDCWKPIYLFCFILEDNAPLFFSSLSFEFGMIWLVDWSMWSVYFCSICFLRLNFWTLLDLFLQWLWKAVVWVWMLCVALVTSVLLMFYLVDWMLHNAPDIFSSISPLTFSLYFPLLILPTACICTFTKHHFAKCIIFFFLLYLYVMEMSLELGSACWTNVIK